jgi:hypothetical protein
MGRDLSTPSPAFYSDIFPSARGACPDQVGAPLRSDLLPPGPVGITDDYCFKSFSCNTYRKHGVGTVCPFWFTPSAPGRNSSLATLLNSFPFTLLRTFLRSRKTQPVSFQALPHSLQRTTRVGVSPFFAITPCHAFPFNFQLSTVNLLLCTVLPPITGHGSLLVVSCG